MRLTLYQHSTALNGATSRITRQFKPQDCLTLAAGDPLRPELLPQHPIKGNGTWSATIELPDDLASEAALRSLWLQIDEIEYFLPATLPGQLEPLSDEGWKNFDPLLWQASGPRFSAQIDLRDLLEEKAAQGPYTTANGGSR